MVISVPQKLTSILSSRIDSMRNSRSEPAILPTQTSSLLSDGDTIGKLTLGMIK